MKSIHHLIMADTLQSKVTYFSVDANDAETQCADICREFKHLSTKPITPELEALSNSFGAKIATLDDDPRQDKFTAIFERVMFGVDFEFKVSEFVKVIDAYCARGCTPYVNQSLQAIATDLTIKSQILCRHGTEDINAIVPVLRTTMERLNEICNDTELADGLALMFKSTLRQYDAEHRLDQSIDRLKNIVKMYY